MTYDVSDDNHIEKFIFAAALGGTGAIAEDLLWRKIYDIEKTENDLNKLTQEYSGAEMQNLIQNIENLKVEIDKMVNTIESKKRTLEGLRVRRQQLKYTEYEEHAMRDLRNMGAFTVESFTERGSGDESMKIRRSIREAIRKIEKEKAVRLYMKQPMGEMNTKLVAILRDKIPYDSVYTLDDLEKTLQKFAENLRSPERNSTDDEAPDFETPDFKMDEMMFQSANRVSSTEKCPPVHRIEYIYNDPETELSAVEKDSLQSTRTLQQIGDPDSYVLERGDMHDRVLDIIEDRERDLVMNYNVFLKTFQSSGVDQFFQLWTLFEMSKTDPGGWKRKGISACSRALLKALAVLGKLDRIHSKRDQIKTNFIENIKAVTQNDKCAEINSVFSYEIEQLFENYISFALR